MPRRAISTISWPRSILREWHPDARREVLDQLSRLSVLGRADFPVTSGVGIGELREILIDRISPQDAHALKGFDGQRTA